MPNFFDFKPNDMTKMPAWVRFPTLPLRCWTPLCLSKLASVIGKPIHCNGPTTNMARLSYARVLIKVDLLRDLSSSVNVILPNGSPLAQQVMYESLPRFCKQCYVLGHTVSTCHKGLKHKKRPRTFMMILVVHLQKLRQLRNNTCTIRALLLTLQLILCLLKLPPLNSGGTHPLGIKGLNLLHHPPPNRPQDLSTVLITLRICLPYRLKDNT